MAQMTLWGEGAPKLSLEPALSLHRVRPGDIVHIVSGDVVGIDTADGAVYRLAPRWGGTAEEVLAVCAREGWDYRALSAAGAYVKSNPHTLSDPDIVARMLPPRRSALAGLVGARAGVYAETWHYDRVSAYPSLALHGVPSPFGWRLDRSIPDDSAACGFVVGDFSFVDRRALPDGAGESVQWLTLDEYRYLVETDAIARADIEYALVTERREWTWFVNAQRELYAKRLMHVESTVYKVALNGIIGRLASTGGYERWVIGEGEDAIPIGRGKYVSYRVQKMSRTRAAAYSVTADIVARQRIDMARLTAQPGAVWWYVDAVTVTSPLPPALTGTAPGCWRLLHSGESKIVDWRGGIVAGKRKVASLPVERWSSLCG